MLSAELMVQHRKDLWYQRLPSWYEAFIGHGALVYWGWG